jgi:hypothetical protein
MALGQGKTARQIQVNSAEGNFALFQPLELKSENLQAINK